MRVNEPLYAKDIEKLLAQYRSAMDAHLSEMESMMSMEAIPAWGFFVMACKDMVLNNTGRGKQ